MYTLYTSVLNNATPPYEVKFQNLWYNKNYTLSDASARASASKNMAKKFVRKLQRSGTHSYMLNIPKELVSEFKWRDRQKLVIEFGGRKHDLVIKDWEK